MSQGRGRGRQARRRSGAFPLVIFLALIVVGVGIVVAFANHFVDTDQIVEDVTGEPVEHEEQGAGTEGSWPISGTVSLAVDSTDYLYDNPYDWSHLSWDSHGNYAYVVRDAQGQEVTLSREGVDVSQHNGSIDWAKVRDDGIDYAIVRIGAHGTSKDTIVVDDNFKRNLVGARAAGLGVGVYFYSQATTDDEARTEANFVLEQLGGEQLSYPVVFDFEPVNGDRAWGLTTAERTSIASTFCSTIKAGGYDAAIYSSSSDLTNEYNLEGLAQYGFWMAQYSSVPTTSVAFTMWQYTNQGAVAGIDGDVDLNIDLTPALQAAEGEISY